MSRPRTREVTLHRLPHVESTRDGMFDALVERMPNLDDLGADLQPISVGEAPAIWLDCQFDRSEADWCADASHTTGLPVSRPRVNAAGLLVLGVDGVTYAIGYGSGHLLIPDELVDPRFGLSFMIRRLDPGQVQDLVRRMPGSGGRTDATSVPGGLPVWSLGSEQHADIISRLGGRLSGMTLTFTANDRRPARAEGSAGLRIRLGVQPEDLVSDIREIARVCRECPPDPALEFIDHIRPVAERHTLGVLEAKLDAILGGDVSAGAVSATVPTTALDDFRRARTFRITVGAGTPVPLRMLETEAFLRRTRIQRSGHRAEALRVGQVSMYGDEEANDRLSGCNAAKWLEASASLGPRRFFMLDGCWHEIGDDYSGRVRAEIAHLFGRDPSLDLPIWDLRSGWDERDYNEHVASVRAGYVCLDRKGVPNPLGRSNTMEVCDLLGPDDELIHVKRASGSAPLSQLFAQGLVSAQNLLFAADVRGHFAAKVGELAGGRVVAPAFRPKKVVFAVLLKKGRELTLDTLFPFSQVTLASTARILQSHQIDVEVIGIESDT